jgi:flagellar hook-associated protein 2
MPIAIDGIVSGLDTTSLINAVLTARTVSIDTLKGRLADLEEQREAVAGISNRMSTLSSTIAPLEAPQDLLSYGATTTSTSFSVSASSSALPGSYALRVHALAAAQVSESQGASDPAAHTLAKGTLSVTVGGVATDIVVDDANNSLTDLAASLNQVDGLSAWVLNTGAATDPYRLVVQGDDTGLANAFTFDTAGLSGGDVPAFTQRAAAADAVVELSGVTIQSASNRLVDVVPGLTFDLQAPNAVAEAVTVQRDDEAIRTRVQGLVDAYNELVVYHATQSVFNSEAGLKGPLSGEATTRRALEDLSTTVTRQFTVPGTAITALSSLGVSTGRDGQLEFDADAFTAALQADPDGIATFLTDDAGPLASIARKIDELYVDSDTGSLSSRGESLASSIEDMNLQIERAEERLVVHADILRSQFTAMEILLSRLQTSQGFIANLLASTPTASSSSSS